MLFILTQELCLDKTNPKYTLMKKAVRNLAIVTIESQHLLFVDCITTAIYFIKLFKSDEDISNFFYLIKGTFYTTDYSFIKRRIDVKIDSSHPYMDDDILVFPTSVDMFQTTSSCQKSIVLGENSTDVDLFNLILKWYLVKESISVNTEFDKESGGGTTTKEVLKTKLDASKIILAIIDSDVKYPGCKIGDTLKDCKSMLFRQCYAFKLHSLDVHEIENLLPFSFIDHPQMFHAEVALNKMKFDLIRSNNPELLKYFDVKKGIKKNALFDSEEKYRDFAKECCSCDTTITDFNAHVDSSVLNNKVIFPGIESKIMRKALDHPNNKDRFSFDLYDFQNVEWQNIGQLMLDFTCARNKESIIS